MPRPYASPSSQRAASVLAGLRRQAGIRSQEDLAPRLKRSRQWVGQFEAGRSELDLDVLDRYANVLGVRSSDLFAAISEEAASDLTTLRMRRIDGTAFATVDEQWLSELASAAVELDNDRLELLCSMAEQLLLASRADLEHGVEAAWRRFGRKVSSDIANMGDPPA